MFYKTLSSWAASSSGIIWCSLCLLDRWQTVHKASWSSSQKNKSLFPWALQRSSGVCADSLLCLSSLHCSVSSRLDCCLARKLSTMFLRTKLAGGLSLRHSVLQTGHVLLNWPFQQLSMHVWQKLWLHSRTTGLMKSSKHTGQFKSSSENEAW